MKVPVFKMGEAVKRGEITAFLSLIFLLLLSFAGAMMESVSIQILKNNKRADMSLALESVFAEYQREVLDAYDIFVLDGSYGTREFDEKNIVRRLTYYGAEREGNEIQKSRLLTDASGNAFFEQAVRYMKNKVGLDVIQDEKNESSLWEEQEESAKCQQEEEAKVQHNLEALLEESEEGLPEKDNPIQSVAAIQQSGLLKVIVQDSEQLSKKSVRKEQLASVRQLQKGKGTFSGQTEQNHMSDRVFFDEYLMGHFGNFTEAKEESVLDYELEYLLGGHESDQTNLESVMKKILAIRFALNYAYLLTDEGKKAEAGALALTMCSLLSVPGITEVVKQAILLAWAYGEGISDLRTLAKGRKVPVVKNAENWKLQLSALLHLAEETGPDSGNNSEEGISYRDYIRGFLLLEKEEVLSMRALDLIEGNLGIKADHLLTELEVKSRCGLRRNISYEFVTYFGYQ